MRTVREWMIEAMLEDGRSKEQAEDILQRADKVSPRGETFSYALIPDEIGRGMKRAFAAGGKTFERYYHAKLKPLIQQGRN